jgi:hypothetical protein
MSYHNYPSQPIGGGNPYYACSSCGITDPQINGRLEGHARSCEWRKAEEARLLMSAEAIELEKANAKIRDLEESLAIAERVELRQQQWISEAEDRTKILRQAIRDWYEAYCNRDADPEHDFAGPAWKRWQEQHSKFLAMAASLSGDGK